MKLGKLAPVHDPRTLRLEKYLAAADVPPLPAGTNYRDKVRSWPVRLNDRIGNCTIASGAHQILCWTTNDGAPFDPSDAEVVKAYSAVSGYDPRTGRNDNGAVLLNVVKYWRSNGIAGRKISAFASVNPRNVDALKYSVFLFDGLITGIQLPQAAEGMDVWKAPQNPTGRWAKGSWGGHAVPIVDYDKDYLYCVSWGKIIPISYHFWSLYGDEAFAVFSPDWFGADYVAPNGFHWNDLVDDLKQITGGIVDPVPRPTPPPVDPVPIPPPPAPSFVDASVVLGGKTYAGRLQEVKPVNMVFEDGIYIPSTSNFHEDEVLF